MRVCLAVRQSGIWIFNPDKVQDYIRDWVGVDINAEECKIDFNSVSDLDIDIMCGGDIVIRRRPREVIVRSGNDILLSTKVAVYIDDNFNIEDIREEELEIEQQGYIVEYNVNTREVEIIRNYSWHYEDYDHDGYESIEVYKFVKKLFENTGIKEIKEKVH